MSALVRSLLFEVQTVNNWLKVLNSVVWSPHSLFTRRRFMSDLNSHTHYIGTSYLCEHCRTFGDNRNSGNQTQKLQQSNLDGHRRQPHHRLQAVRLVLRFSVWQNQRQPRLLLAFFEVGHHCCQPVLGLCWGQQGLAHCG